MKRILITGATGNIGKPIIDNIDYSKDIEVYAGVRHPGNDFTDKPIKTVFFDFDDLEKCIEALEGIDYLFLLRPPHISNITKYFKPLINACVVKKVKHIIFLSVQDVDKSTFIPHNKIEKLIKTSGLTYTFLRPGYFMQNLSVPLKYDILEHERIYIPAGKAKFNWINADDIGIAAARILESPEDHENKIYTLTGSENLNFDEVVRQMSEVLDYRVHYTSPNAFRFYFNKRSKGLKPTFILIMIMLHYLPRFQKDPEIFDDIIKLTGKKPLLLKDFLQQNKSEWQKR